MAHPRGSVTDRPLPTSTACALLLEVSCGGGVPSPRYRLAPKQAPEEVSERGWLLLGQAWALGRQLSPSSSLASGPESHGS